ncbi:MAG: alpha/beta fold hydrolase [Acidimicrobiales bacterium]
MSKTHLADDHPWLLRLPGGRQVAVHHSGDSGQPAIMVFHGTPGSGALLSLASIPAAELGVRLLCINRPGYGRSTRSTPGFEIAVRDALSAADILGMQRFAVVGVSGGGPYAAAVAVAAPERVRAVGIAGGLGPWREVEASDTWDPDDVVAVELAEGGAVAQAEEVTRIQCRAHFEALLEGPDDILASTFLAESEDGGLRRFLVADLREALSSFDGLIYDNLTLGMQWSWKPEDVRQPVWLWYGETDTTVALSHARWYQRQLPHHQLEVRPGEGHGATVLQHWAEMLGTLSAAMG